VLRREMNVFSPLAEVRDEPITTKRQFLDALRQLSDEVTASPRSFSLSCVSFLIIVFLMWATICLFYVVFMYNNILRLFCFIVILVCVRYIEILVINYQKAAENRRLRGEVAAVSDHSSWEEISIVFHKFYGKIPQDADRKMFLFLRRQMSEAIAV
jgi:hypothetical protein